MELGYVCTNYNNSSYTRTAVDTLLYSSNHKYRIVVVDNASDAENINLVHGIQHDYPCVDAIYSKKNLGYFRGLNMGIRHLAKKFPDIEWMVVGNNDLEFPENFADALEENRGRLSIWPVVSPDVVTLDGVHQNPHVIENISKVREFFYDIYYSNYYIGCAVAKLAAMMPSLTDRLDEQQWRIARPIYQGHGSCYILTPKFFELFGELWTPTFMGAEEFFLSKQLQGKGYQIFYDPCVQISHRWHASLSTLPGKRRWQMFRDAHREYRKYVKVFG